MNWNSRIFYNKNNKFPKFGEKRKFSELNQNQKENKINLISNNLNNRVNYQINNVTLNNLNINNSNLLNERSLETAIKDNSNNRSALINHKNENLVNKEYESKLSEFCKYEYEIEQIFDLENVRKSL